MNYLDMVRKYRTMHSIIEEDVLEVSRQLSTISDAKYFLDFGCHFGHLSIYLALNHDVTIYAVDNFVGTIGDEPMKNTILSLTNGDGDFKETLIKNIREANTVSGNSFKGRIIPMYADEFFENNKIKFDMVYIDSSHGPDSIGEFLALESMVKSGGIISGHDNSHIFPDVQRAILEISPKCDPILMGYSWFMRKK